MFRFEEADSRYLIAREIEHNHNEGITAYEQLFAHWLERARAVREGGEPFSMVLVTDLIHDDHDDHDHDHGEDKHDEHDTDHDRDHDHEHERDSAREDAFSKLLNDFRRDHKADVQGVTRGYARVMAASWMAGQVAENPNAIAEMNEATDRMSRYMWGVPGAMFGSVADALTWLDTLHDPTSTDEDTRRDTGNTALGSARVGLFYGSTTGVTEQIAEQIAAAWAEAREQSLPMVNIGGLHTLDTLLQYDSLILGIPTWNVGQLQDDWRLLFSELDALDFAGKQVALFGIGDAANYPDNFLDAMGTLGDRLRERGATLCGFWPTAGYDFIESKAVEGDQFIGLAIDEVNQDKLTAGRVRQWVAQVAAEFSTEFAGEQVAQPA